jgi:hypothetical protein
MSLKHVSFLLVPGLLVVGPLWAQKSAPGAYDKFYKPTLSPAKRGANDSLARRAGIKYQLLYVTNTGDIPRSASPSRVFHQGEKVKIQIESNIDGYLYIWMKGSSGAQRLLYPDKRINDGKNLIRSWQRLTVPLWGSGWFQITDEPGEDVLTLIVSRTPLMSQQPQDDNKTYAAMRERLPSDTRDLELITEEKAQTAQATDTETATIVVNLNTLVNEVVFAEVRIRHK